ncbi:TPA: hypothetical protein N3A08_002103 [Salmonella enterica subsp. salamae serovar 9,46:z4,z24:z39:z42]|uniref:Uncharacterized protein n=1 Tax=Salmonella enterica subsp. salamae TaxID=59202 RepID=A0A8E6IDD0_SALER|nr:hypothetical protein [Salmonella enterica]ECJ2540695.1 hypothetical protein [Salmonella enterica subsp. salamae]HCM1953059.1 hypothetical protein [Salmonella enterica subsp. salamae serovar 9,46:z4,z24:z39:z42]EBP0113680.1 hypothetical protein [Salmonella enterica]EIY7070297.1 hypothetical protein [Salmonella enterica]EKT7565962.1 hypothetical protein [Salmonella enterica]
MKRFKEMFFIGLFTLIAAGFSVSVMASDSAKSGNSSSPHHKECKAPPLFPAGGLQPTPLPDPCWWSILSKLT